MHKMITAIATAAVAATFAVSTAGAAPTMTSPATAKTEHFAFMSTSATSPLSSVIATGAFTAGGTDRSGSNPDLESLRFPGGTLKFRHSGHSTIKVNPTTCLVAVAGSGTYKLFDGTGAYKGVSGSGKFTTEIRAVAARTSKGKCSQTANPVAWQFTVTGSGPVKLP